jgi:acid phosphatase (class A)
MKKVLLMAIAIVTATNILGQNKFPEGYFTDETRPKDYDFIKAPPSLTGGDFANDFYYYQWGRKQRETEGVSEQAIFDEAAQLYEVFSHKVLGFELNHETTPEILRLCERAVSDAIPANTTVKNIYQRQRPFATFNDPSLKPEEDEEEAKTFSYPSGHSTRGYIFALTLITVMPELTTQIMERAQEYAINRIICGHHWKSDIDASLLLASGVFANIVCTDEFQEQLIKARAEYQQIMNGTTGASALRMQPSAASQAYTIHGIQATDASRGIIIQNGQKAMRK